MENLKHELEVLKESEKIHLEEVEYLNKKAEKFLFELKAIQERISHLEEVIKNK